MYSMIPTITKPSRLTVDSAPLIDNIFTNNIKSKTATGFLKAEITDHLALFVIQKCQFKKDRKTKIIRYTRKRREEDLMAMNEERTNVNQSNILYI